MNRAGKRWSYKQVGDLKERETRHRFMRQKNKIHFAFYINNSGYLRSDGLKGSRVAARGPISRVFQWSR